jgi:hypothetical protein
MGALALTALLAASFGGVALAQAAAPAASVPSAPAVVAPALEGLGIELVGLELTAENYLVGLRYRVIDPGKSRTLVEHNVHPVLVNESTGERYYVPQMRAPRSPQQKRPLSKAHRPPVQAQPGKTYVILFANPDRKLRAGEKVTLYAGESVLQHIEVR